MEVKDKDRRINRPNRKGETALYCACQKKSQGALSLCGAGVKPGCNRKSQEILMDHANLHPLGGQKIIFIPLFEMVEEKELRRNVKEWIKSHTSKCG